MEKTEESLSGELVGWRRIADAWPSPTHHGQICIQLELDARPLLRFMRSAAVRHCAVRPAHLVGRAVAYALGAVPALNVRFAGHRVIRRDSVDIFFTVATSGGAGLTGLRITDAMNKGALDIADELRRRAEWVAAGEDPFGRAKRLANRLPRPILRAGLRAAEWLASSRAMPLSWLGLTAMPFGSAIVTDMEALGFPGLAPSASVRWSPLHIVVGAIVDRPVVVSGRVEVQPTMPLTLTADAHYAAPTRFVEGLQAMQSYLADPEAFEPAWGVIPIQAQRDVRPKLRMTVPA